uniref:Fibronectin type-III domain-containing protein n=1 Tax=Cacopsylla melanoneura TaxID=428564 RepID=A0A8D9BHK7_9HEMI
MRIFDLLNREYQIRTILLDEALETHDPSLTEPFEFELCEGETLKVENLTNTSIGISWAQEIDEGDEGFSEPTVCHTEGYKLEINQIENDKFHKERVITTVKNSYEIKNLSPGQTYNIELKKLMKDNEYVPLSNTNVTTRDEVIDSSDNIMGVTISKTKSVVYVEWFASPIYTTFYVKYKLRRYLPCTEQETTSTLHVATTSNTSYSLELKDLESNALYELFVTGDENQNVNPQNSSFTTTLDTKTWKCNNLTS